MIKKANWFHDEIKNVPWADPIVAKGMPYDDARYWPERTAIKGKWPDWLIVDPETSQAYGKKRPTIYFSTTDNTVYVRYGKHDGCGEPDPTLIVNPSRRTSVAKAINSDGYICVSAPHDEAQQDDQATAQGEAVQPGPNVIRVQCDVLVLADNPDEALRKIATWHRADGVGDDVVGEVMIGKHVETRENQ